MTQLSTLSLLVLIAHFLGDYHFQSESMVRAKQRSLRGLLRHIGVQGLLLLPLLLFAGISRDLTWVYLGLTILAGHFVLDFLKLVLDRQKQKSAGRYEAVIYVIDQVLHVTLILVLSTWVFPVFPPAWLQRDWLTWGLLAVLITKPANVTFKILFRKYRFFEIPNPQKAVSETQAGAGALIGNLERLLSAIFLGTGQVAAIGLIYTAKSIARFKKIEENQSFAEYYLIGTLYSILYVTVFFYLIV